MSKPFNLFGDYGADTDRSSRMMKNLLAAGAGGAEGSNGNTANTVDTSRKMDKGGHPSRPSSANPLRKHGKRSNSRSRMAVNDNASGIGGIEPDRSARSSRY